MNMNAGSINRLFFMTADAFFIFVQYCFYCAQIHAAA